MQLKFVITGRHLKYCATQAPRTVAVKAVINCNLHASLITVALVNWWGGRGRKMGVVGKWVS
ncbi:hypothetical protein Ct61P_11691 [Colletotrichum tofieldiae]|nr:hypothetical protein Ct61P_11691 [Colletotrichum tofieldiae]